MPLFRRYKAWLLSTLQKEALSREDLQKILRGQLLLPEKKRDAALMLECAAALDELEGQTYPGKETTWRRITAALATDKSRVPRLPRRRAVLILVLLLVLALAAAAVASFSPKVFSFLMGEGSPDSYVQRDAEGLLKTNLGRIRGGHVEITITEAAYDGWQLRVVYSIRDLNSHQMFTDEDAMNGAGDAMGKLANQDGFNTIGDWVTVNGQDAMLSDAGQKGGDQPGEILYYLQALLGDQDIFPVGDFTVAVPLARRQAEGSPYPRAYAPPELTFTLNAEEGKKSVRSADPAEITAEGVDVELYQATFSPIAGALYLRLTGADQAAVEKAAEKWWLQSQLYAMDGTQTGICSPEYMSGYTPDEGISIKLDVVPPETWPEEMVLALPDAQGGPDSTLRLPVALVPRQRDIIPLESLSLLLYQ